MLLVTIVTDTDDYITDSRTILVVLNMISTCRHTVRVDLECGYHLNYRGFSTRQTGPVCASVCISRHCETGQASVHKYPRRTLHENSIINQSDSNMILLHASYCMVLLFGRLQF